MKLFVHTIFSVTYHRSISIFLFINAYSFKYLNNLYSKRKQVTYIPCKMYADPFFILKLLIVYSLSIRKRGKFVHYYSIFQFLLPSSRSFLFICFCCIDKNPIRLFMPNFLSLKIIHKKRRKQNVFPSVTTFFQLIQDYIKEAGKEDSRCLGK